MKWLPQDVETYSAAKEYVDTAVVPLYSITIGKGVKQSAAASEFITLLTNYLERQFTGRILLFPPFTYLGNEQDEKVLTDLKKWEESILDAGFKHVFYVTSDFEWRSREGELNGTLIWLPAIPLEQMNDTQKLTMIDSQVQQLLTIFTQKWQKSD
ncbi:YpiF family protein [Neobacillus mesonae]|uniref:YpiF family protein n=1 Tax=Neobacillus mesonae TaxID=1193713 RepID=UPI00203C3C77|nr:YpiF family protein [Neobacillus mesonae]MCM3566797.1 YpiF family protein [Neobacillus mesonae]